LTDFANRETNQMKVYPAPGRLVRDPKSMMLLPAEGREVRDDDPFWVRRVRDGDVTMEQPPPPEQSEAQ
jgi:hypothetical protein